MKLHPAVLLLALMLPVSAAPPPEIHVERHRVILVAVRPMTAFAEDREKTLPLRLDSAGGIDGSIEFRWPDAGSNCNLVVAVKDISGVLSEAQRIRLDAVLTLPDGTEIEANRELTVRGETTALFEIYRLGDRSLTLSVEISFDTETRYRARPTATAPVQLRLEIERVEDGQNTPLESNILRTFVGRSVSYSFDLGGSQENDALTLELLPTSLGGGIMTLEVTLTGRIATESGLEWTSRSQRILSSAGIRTVVPVSAGSPPVGYRFVVTPNF